MSANTLTRLSSDDGSGKDANWKRWSAEVDGMEERIMSEAKQGTMQQIPWGLESQAARFAPQADRRSVGRYAMHGVRIGGIETNFGFVMRAEIPPRIN